MKNSRYNFSADIKNLRDMKFFLQFLAVFALALVCQGKNINGHLNFARLVDQCPDFSALGNFSLDSSMGVWHEILRYPNPMEVGCSCAYIFKLTFPAKICFEFVFHAFFFIKTFRFKLSLVVIIKGNFRIWVFGLSIVFEIEKLI